MKIIYPTRLTFWRFIFGVTALLLIRSILQLIEKATLLGVDFSVSRAWLALVAGLGLIALFVLFLLASTWSQYRERILSFMEAPERAAIRLRWLGGLLLPAAWIGFMILFKFPFLSLLAGLIWVRFLAFWAFGLAGMYAIKLLRPQVPWFIALIGIVLSQSTLHLLSLYWSRVTDYPFAMGWSETSRFYYPSFFFSNRVYGQRYPWPIQNPSLHLLLSAPYLFNASLFAHRFWQVALRYIFVGALVPIVLKRLSIQGRGMRWLVGLWMFLFLFMGPVYFHLAISVMIVLLGFSQQDHRRTWMAVLLASFWCGWSRVNWYPMPGILAALLYLMEVPLRGKNIWRYLTKPALWFVIGTLFAFLSQRVYIALSGITDTRLFYTSFISDLLWYRLWPNSSFSFGILPGIVWTSLPMWFVIYRVLRSPQRDWHPLRLIFIFAALLAICVGGIIVSLKIGGGANLHNMDGYFILLLIVSAYLGFARYASESGAAPRPSPLHWLLVIALLYSPVTTFIQFGVGFKTYNPAETQKILASLQEHVDSVNSQGGEILFITQRHLISMHTLNDVELVYEYEREDLMEMAMSNNQPYLAEFRKDMQDQRFALIVVDPLNYNFLARGRSFSEENNAWVKRVVKHILCNYREEAVFPEDEIALYVPQVGERQCP